MIRIEDVQGGFCRYGISPFEFSCCMVDESFQV